MAAASPVVVRSLRHAFGRGELRSCVLHDISAEIRSGEIVIATGPSGSGKTTLLTLVGALRSVQEGSVRVLGDELRGASRRRLQSVRRRIGYIFQSHNLLDALTARQNVELALRVDRSLSSREIRARSTEMLEAVGLGERLDQRPASLSGGQRQRVAVARALVGRPRIILADEPTASLDGRSGRDVVEIMQRLAREQGVSVLLVTHDSRILGIADRILHVEDGRLSSFTDAVVANTQHMMALVADAQRKGELARRVADMPVAEFSALLARVAEEARTILEVSERSANDAFESMLEQAVSAFTLKLPSVLAAERASIFLVDREAGELWLQVAQEESGGPVELRMPIDRGIAGRVARSGEAVLVEDAYADPDFNPEVDRRTGFRTRSVLCVPLLDSRHQVFAVAQLLNRRDGLPFDRADEARFSHFMASIAVLLQTWSRTRRAHPSPGASPRGPDPA